MKIKKLLFAGLVSGLSFVNLSKAQAPVASFSLSANPVCSGSTNVMQITDLSTGAPTSWIYSITAQGGGPGGGATTTLSTQNPTLSFNGPGTVTITLISSNGSGASTPVVQTLTVLASPNGNINPNNSTTCPGGNPVTLTFAAGGGPGGGGTNTYAWSTGATTSSIVVTPSATTVFTCVVTATNGCSNTRTATLTVAPATATVASNPVALCPGSPATLTATGSNPGPFTYSWSSGATTRTISTSLTGVYTVTVTNSNGCSATQTYSLGSSTTLSLTAVADPSVLCAGSTATLHVTGGATYSWDNGATAANVTVNPTSNTSYTVNGFIGTCTGSTSITLSVNVTPTLSTTSSSSVVCNGHSVILNANGATTFTWLPSTVSQSVSMTPSVNTTYVVRGNNPGCPTRTAAITINVNQNPTISISSSSMNACAGDAIALAAFGADTYTWSNNSNAAVFIVQPTVTTVYSLTGTAANGCTTTASITQSVTVCTGLVENAGTHNSGLTIYPNPSSGHVLVLSGTKESGETKANVYDQTGRLVKSVVLEGGVENELNLETLTNGIYYLQVENTSVSLGQKIILKKE